MVDDLARLRTLAADASGPVPCCVARALPVLFDEGAERRWTGATHAPPMAPSFVRLGLDLVEWKDRVECSTLLCNGLAARLGANRYSLLDRLEHAVDVARRLHELPCEPGPYAVLEVWAERFPDA